MRITIPRDDAQAAEVANAATLSGWALAGYVASQVRLSDTGGRPTESARTSTLLTPVQFAAKGIRGLRSKDTVRLYAERWRDHVGEPPRPGQVLNLPDMDWPPDDVHRRLDNGPRREAVERQAEADGVSAASAIRVAESPTAMAAAIKADPLARKAAAEALVSSDEGLDAVFEANSNRPQVQQEARQNHRAAKAREAAESEQTHHLRGFKALPVLWEAENLAEYIETKIARDPEDLAYARNAGLWLQAIGRRIVAWADGETLPMSDDDFAAEIEALLGESR